MEIRNTNVNCFSDFVLNLRFVSFNRVTAVSSDIFEVNIFIPQLVLNIARFLTMPSFGWRYSLWLGYQAKRFS